MEKGIPVTKLGDGLEIKKIVHGLWQTGGGHGNIDVKFAIFVMKEIHKAGFTSFDGADHYGPAEELMGRLWMDLGPKASTEMAQHFTKWCPASGKMTEEIVRKAIDKSLNRMKTNQIHLLQFHWWDYGNEEYITALKHLQTLKTEGKILHLALTNFDTIHLQNIVENHHIPIVSNQVSYSIIDWRPEISMVPFCQKHNIHLLTYGTLLGGFFSEQYVGKPQKDLQFDTVSKRKYFRFIESWGGWSLFLELLEILSKISKKHNTSIANIATKYILDKPAVGAVIIGARLGLTSHLPDTKKVFDVNLDEADRKEIEGMARRGNVLPGDCGQEYRN